MPAPGTPVPDELCTAPFVGAEPAPEDAVRAALLRQNEVMLQVLDQLQPDSLTKP